VAIPCCGDGGLTTVATGREGVSEGPLKAERARGRLPQEAMLGRKAVLWPNEGRKLGSQP